MTTLHAVVTLLQQHAPVSRAAAETVRVYGAPPPGTIETNWLPHSIGGILSLIAAMLLVTGAGSFAAMWRWLLRPVYAKIESERKDLEIKMQAQVELRGREIATERGLREQSIDAIINRERGFLTLHKRELKGDLNGIGVRCDTLESRSSKLEERSRALEDRMRDSENDRNAIHKEVGELTGDVRAMREEQLDMKQSIINHIQESKREVLSAVDKNSTRIGDLETTVAVIRDRQNRHLDKGEVQ